MKPRRFVIWIMIFCMAISCRCMAEDAIPVDLLGRWRDTALIAEADGSVQLCFGGTDYETGQYAIMNDQIVLRRENKTAIYICSVEDNILTMTHTSNGSQSIIQLKRWPDDNSDEARISAGREAIVGKWSNYEFAFYPDGTVEVFVTGIVMNGTYSVSNGNIMLEISLMDR